jgi:Trk K+ transport system NAD-binding subunit
MRIAIIGAGRVGAALAQGLMCKGHAVTPWRA